MDRYAARWGLWAVAAVVAILLKYVLPPVVRKLRELLQESRFARVTVAVLCFLTTLICFFLFLSLTNGTSWGMWMGIGSLVLGVIFAILGFKLLKRCRMKEEGKYKIDLGLKVTKPKMIK